MTWEVVLYESEGGETVLDEITNEGLTPKQLSRVRWHLARLERHGPDLDGDFFDRVQGSNELQEYRVSADRIEVRMLYVLEGQTYTILKIFRHKKRRDLQRMAPIAERRLEEWRRR